MPRNWFRQHASDDAIHPGRRIDQELADRSHRLGIGILINEDYSTAKCTLVVTEGRGKFLRLKHSITEVQEIPNVVAETCQRVANAERPVVGDLTAARFDVAQQLAQFVNSIKQHAGKYVDRIMYVAVNEPGIMISDFDGNQSFEALLDPLALADLTGITVIDSLPQRDLAAGGNGRNLTALPIWMLLADRAKVIASKSRVWMSIGANTDCLYLPPSDGLEAELPGIQHCQGLGEHFIYALGECVGLDSATADFNQLNIDGQFDSILADHWQRQFVPGTRPRQGNRSDDILATLSTLPEQSNLETRRLADVIRTGIVFVIRQVAEQLALSCPIRRVGQVLVQSDSALKPSFLNQLERVLPIASTLECEIVATEKTAISGGQIESVASTLLGMLYVDQLPSNIPWITGAGGQRVVGRVTPGNAANWRQLVRDMADFQPPSMRLRDAI